MVSKWRREVAGVVSKQLIKWPSTGPCRGTIDAPNQDASRRRPRRTFSSRIGLPPHPRFTQPRSERHTFGPHAQWQNGKAAPHHRRGGPRTLYTCGYRWRKNIHRQHQSARSSRIL